MGDRELMRRGAITFLDVIGWKRIWQRMDDAVERLERLDKFAEAIGESIQKGRFQRLSQQGLEPKIQGLSDTIAIITVSESPLRVLELHAEIAAMLIVDSITAGIPLRGATAYGQFHLTKNNYILVGPAVDDVGDWFESFRMIGVIHAPSADEELSKGGFERPDLLVDYPVPTKSAATIQAHSVNWPHRWQLSQKRREDLNRLLLDMEGQAQEQDKLIYRNTIAFYDHVVSRSSR